MRLAQDSDVYAYAYGQNAALDQVAEVDGLLGNVRMMRKIGYRAIVLVGHSAGGLIARQFVEDHPDAGVTKVIQVCSPNAGSNWATVKTVRSNQVEFMDSLTKNARRRSLDQRGDKQIPAGVEFACIVGTAAGNGDGLVLRRCQWPEDLQEQGARAYPVLTTHWFAPRSKKGIDCIADLVREPQPRWDTGQVTAARRVILGN
jgi:pimeloyl-ACP methyl ester carboxylesterase